MFYSIYIQCFSLFEEAPPEIPAGRTEKTEADKKNKMPGESYITGSGGIQTNQKGRRGAFIVKLTVGFPKVEAMIVQPDGVRLDTGDTHSNTH